MDTLPPHAQDGNPTKCCKKCKRTLPATPEYFPRCKSGKYGLRGDCRVCNAKSAKERRRLPGAQEQTRIYNKARNNREDAYYKRPEIKEIKHAYDKLYRNQPEVKEHQRAWRKIYDKDYYTRPEVQIHNRVKSHVWRARKKAVTGTYTPAQILDLLKRQRHKCYYCSKRFQRVKGKYIYHIDHTFPLSRVAGTDIPANDISYLVLTCPTCNISKHDRFPWEFPEGGRLL